MTLTSFAHPFRGLGALSFRQFVVQIHGPSHQRDRSTFCDSGDKYACSRGISDGTGMSCTRGRVGASGEQPEFPQLTLRFWVSTKFKRFCVEAKLSI